ncbi:MAG: ribonuclease III [Thermomicrobiales bacterium]
MSDTLQDRHVDDVAEITAKPARSRRKSAVRAPMVLRLPDLEQESQLAERIGIQFDDPRRLRLALTHRSVLQDWSNVGHVDAIMQSNERLEFLGDAILGAVVAEFLYDRDPLANEGSLTRRRVAIVRAETLVRWSREIGLPQHLYLGMGEKVTEGARDRILAGAFEALVGGIWIDRGRNVAEAMVMSFLRRDLESILTEEEEANPKGRLQEIAQERASPTPDYVTIGSEGPDHARQFTVAVEIDGERLGEGRGRSKREAQQHAAREALRNLTVGDLTTGNGTKFPDQQGPSSDVG